MKLVPPLLGASSFSCPHCGAIAHQTWWTLYTEKFDTEKKPRTYSTDEVERMFANPKPDANFSTEQLEKMKKYFLLLAAGEIAIGVESNAYKPKNVSNVFLSECFSCSAVSLWLKNRLIHPLSSEAPAMNEDMPIELQGEYKEAAQILSLSPRGSSIGSNAI